MSYEKNPIYSVKEKYFNNHEEVQIDCNSKKSKDHINVKNEITKFNIKLHQKKRTFQKFCFQKRQRYF